MYDHLKVNPTFPINQRTPFAERVLLGIGSTRLVMEPDDTLRPMRADELPNATEKRAIDAALRDGRLAECEAELDYFQNVMSR